MEFQPFYFGGGRHEAQFTELTEFEEVYHGTHECLDYVPASGFPFMATCFSAGPAEFITTFDLVDATRTPPPVSLATRAGELPTPAFVQVRLKGVWNTLGGNNTCVTPIPPDGGCAPELDDVLTFDVTTGFDAYLDWGNPEPNWREIGEHGPAIAAPGGNIGTINGMDSWLRYPPGSLSYAGGSTSWNSACDTLIPWSVFIADPTVTVTQSMEQIARLRRHSLLAIVYLWIPYGATSGGIWITDAA